MQVGNPLSAAARLDTSQPLDPAILTITPKAEGAIALQTLDRSRLDDIRAKILMGAYDSLATAEQVARNILQSGDVAFRASR